MVLSLKWKAHEKEILLFFLSAADSRLKPKTSYKRSCICPSVPAVLTSLTFLSGDVSSGCWVSPAVVIKAQWHEVEQNNNMAQILCRNKKCWREQLSYRVVSFNWLSNDALRTHSAPVGITPPTSQCLYLALHIQQRTELRFRLKLKSWSSRAAPRWRWGEIVSSEWTLKLYKPTWRKNPKSAQKNICNSLTSKHLPYKWGTNQHTGSSPHINA